MLTTALPLPLIDALIVRALEEDLGAGDVTTEACVPEGALATAHGVARKDIASCGVPVAARVFATIDPSLQFAAKVDEGANVKAGTVLFTVAGSARSLLTAERVALNLIQRMCGVAERNPFKRLLGRGRARKPGSGRWAVGVIEGERGLKRETEG